MERSFILKKDSSVLTTFYFSSFGENSLIISDTINGINDNMIIIVY